MHKNGPSRALILIQARHKEVFVSGLADLIEERRCDRRVPKGVLECRNAVVSHDITVDVTKMSGHSK
jgi:hypothetical protein